MRREEEVSSHTPGRSVCNLGEYRHFGEGLGFRRSFAKVCGLGLHIGCASNFGFGRRRRKANGAIQHVGPLLEFVMESKLLFDGGKREEHELAKVGQGVGGARGHAVLRDGSENIAEDIVDVGGGEEVREEASSPPSFRDSRSCCSS